MPSERIECRESFFETMPGKDLFEMVCGEFLGRGIRRSVFVYLPDPSCVIKFQYVKGGDNWMEWNLWNDMKNMKNSQWLAPCISISENGIYLVQKRTKRPREIHQYVKKVPQFLGDIKYQNFGMYQGRLVCHDYSMNLCANYGVTKVMKKAQWH